MDSPVEIPKYVPIERDYDDAIKAIFWLQNFPTGLELWAHAIDKETFAREMLEDMKKTCIISGINLNNRSVIHVAGTKGKGSTCSTVESIIRNCGFTTGVFTSPHLMCFRERIMINGEAVSKELFAKHFFEIWDLYVAHKLEFPWFFKFMTVVALHIFQELKVDCQILEVGIGGIIDMTNVFPCPAATGITALGFDHMNFLGGTLPEISYNKAGIMKKGSPAFSVSQKPDAFEVLDQYSKKVQSAPLVVAPSYESYNLNSKLSLEGDHQKENASIAIALSVAWLMNCPIVSDQKRQTIFSHLPNWRQYDPNKNNYQSDLFTPLPESFVRGLTTVKWPGRAQHFTSIDLPNVDFFLDGAHTPESAEVCSNWWNTKAKNEKGDHIAELILVLNNTGGRDTKIFLKPFTDSVNKGIVPAFDCAFVPILKRESGISINPEKWDETVCQSIQSECKLDHQNITLSNDTNSTIQTIQSLSQSNPNKRYKVLVTGSLYLVGSVLKSLSNTIE